MDGRAMCVASHTLRVYSLVLGKVAESFPSLMRMVGVATGNVFPIPFSPIHIALNENSQYIKLLSISSLGVPHFTTDIYFFSSQTQILSSWD
jgi:hypothetical protein